MRCRDESQPIVQEPFRAGEQVKKGGTGVVEGEPRIMAVQQGLLLGPEDQQRVGGKIGVFVNRPAEKVQVAPAEDAGEQEYRGEQYGRRLAGVVRVAVGAWTKSPRFTRRRATTPSKGATICE